jgi:leader peptidase (prepilin peptidase)/N-methyltransferase
MIIATGAVYITAKISAFVFGAIWGSFANVLIYRIPRKESIFYPGSHCPKCSRKIRFYENIPILSYIFLQGRCSGCKEEISIRYPVVELLMATLSMSCFVLITGVGREEFDLLDSIPLYILTFYFCFSLLVITFIDLDFRIIPDTLSIPPIPVFFAASFFLEQQTSVNWIQSGLGLVAGGLIIFVIAWLYLLIMKREGMGGGDIKLMAMVGAFSGIQSIPFILFASSFQGILVSIPVYFLSKRKQSAENPGSFRSFEIPFGPFISLAAFEWLFFSTMINDFLQNLIHF